MVKKLDDRSKKFIQDFQSAIASIIDLPLEEQRAWERREALSKFNDYISVESIENRVIDGSHGKIPIRIYSPSENPTEKLPVTVYFHGGGWVYKGIDELEGVCRKLCKSLNSIVVSVEYRLSPENQFPVPLDDCYDAVQWVYDHCEEFHGRQELIGVAGDSAGGNLAATVCLKARDLKALDIAYQILMYPVIDPDLPETPFKDSADQEFMTRDMMQFFWSSYVGSADDHESPYVAPLKAKSLSSLPKAFIITAEHDPLKVEAEAYAKAMENDGCDVTIKQYHDVLHGFIEFPINQEEVDRAYADTTHWFRNKVL